MDQGGKVPNEVDKTKLLRLRGQPGAVTTIRPGLQPGQLPSPPGPARTGEALVTDDIVQVVGPDSDTKIVKVLVLR